MTKLERLIEEARELPAADRLRLIEEVERSVDAEAPSPLASRDYEPLLALAGTAVSEFQGVSTDKYRHLGEAYAPTPDGEG
jgi:hypothetical protein